MGHKKPFLFSLSHKYLSLLLSVHLLQSRTTLNLRMEIDMFTADLS